MSLNLTRPVQGFIMRHPEWGLGLMLLSLHLALVAGISQWWSRTFLVAHIGFFLLWQPVWRGESALTPGRAALTFIGALALVWLTTWWILALWMALLVGLIGGSVLSMLARRQRVAHLTAVLYLLSTLLIWVVPMLFPEREANPAIDYLARYGLALLPIAIVFLGIEETSWESPHVIMDFFYTIMLFMLAAVLVLGSFALKITSQQPYPLALAQTLIITAALLLALGWLWDPRAGFAGLGQLLSRYLLSVGMPFERWLHQLADRAAGQSQPDEFLKLALEDLARLPWVTGGEWYSPNSTGEFGAASKHRAKVSAYELTLVLYTRMALSPALLLHVKLLTQLLGYFYQAKRREEMLERHAYTQAIHETGARLTHDVKNLLQSLTILISAAQQAPESGGALQSLVRRQLPQVTLRLSRTLDKLQAPGEAAATQMTAARWWQETQERYSGEQVEFSARGLAAGTVPAELFDNVVDNLLQNAIEKRMLASALRITVELDCAHGARLSVRDDGAPIHGAVLRNLFVTPVSSSSGYGVGLYQAAMLAAQLGYQLKLAENEPGNVCFTMSPAAASARAAAG